MESPPPPPRPYRMHRKQKAFGTGLQEAPEKQPVGGLTTEATVAVRARLPEPLTPTSEQLAAILTCMGSLAALPCGKGSPRNIWKVRLSLCSYGEEELPSSSL